MSKIEHTPGPWHIEDDPNEPGDVGVYTSDDQLVAVVQDEAGQKWADARLITAAPEMLQALEIISPSTLVMLGDWLDKHHPDQLPHIAEGLRGMASLARKALSACQTA